jgi:hypothetical protein
MNTDVDDRIRDALETTIEQTPTSSAHDAADLVRGVMRRRRRRRRTRNLVVGSALYVASITAFVVLVQSGNDRPTHVGTSNPTTAVSTSPPTTPTTVTTVPTVPTKSVVFSGAGIGSVAFDGPASRAEVVLVANLGPPASDSGWAYDSCAAKPARTLKWGGLEILFVDDGNGGRLVGWTLRSASGEHPPAMRISPAVDFETTWPELQSLGAVWKDGYNVWVITDGQLRGTLSTVPPSASSSVTAIAGGATSLLGC